MGGEKVKGTVVGAYAVGKNKIQPASREPTWCLWIPISELLALVLFLLTAAGAAQPQRSAQLPADTHTFKGSFWELGM